MGETNTAAAGKENCYRRCLAEVVTTAQDLLREEDTACDYGRVQSVKSILGAAIERAETESKRLISAQELLRELITLVACQADPLPEERREAFTILERLKAQHLAPNLESQI